MVDAVTATSRLPCRLDIMASCEDCDLQRSLERAVGRWSRRSPCACAVVAPTARGSPTRCARPAAARTTTSRRTWPPCDATCAGARAICAAPRSRRQRTGAQLQLHHRSCRHDSRRMLCQRVCMFGASNQVSGTRQIARKVLGPYRCSRADYIPTGQESSREQQANLLRLVCMPASVS